LTERATRIDRRRFTTRVTAIWRTILWKTNQGNPPLAQKYPYLDTTRVGVWGHSGGGFATAAAMFRYPDFYKVGISESGNHDNRNYEDDWGERYIGLLSGDNYEKQANQIYAKNLKGKLLIAHGGMDDNVPPYNSYLVVDALVKRTRISIF
jgi:dipeptidyl aminopeptidase/acylaminoacyl peptidase